MNGLGFMEKLLDGVEVEWKVGVRRMSKRSRHAARSRSIQSLYRHQHGQQLEFEYSGFRDLCADDGAES